MAISKEDKAQIDEQIHSLRTEMEQHDKQETLVLNRKNKHIKVWYGILILFMLLLAVPLAFAGKWNAVLSNIAISLWMGLAGYLQTIINRRDFTIAMLGHISDVTRREIYNELDRIQVKAKKIAKPAKKKVKKEAPRANTNAKHNRKK